MQVAHWPPNPIDSGSGNFSAADQTELGSLTGISEQYPQSATLRFAASKTFVVVGPIAQFHRAVSSIWFDLQIIFRFAICLVYFFPAQSSPLLPPFCFSRSRVSFGIGGSVTADACPAIRCWIRDRAAGRRSASLCRRPHDGLGFGV